MTVFRARFCSAALGAGLGAGLVAALVLIQPALGQTNLGPPKTLVPKPVETLPVQPVPPVTPAQPVPGEATVQPAPAAPVTTAQPLTDAPAVVQTPKATAGVQVGSLNEIDPSSVGLLDPGAGGLGTEMWAGSDRGRIERLLPRLPMGTLSPAMQRLARRLLLSSARVPEGVPAAPSLLGIRVERLAAGGLTEDVNRLLSLVPARLTDPAFVRAEMDGLLLTDDLTAYCARVDDLVNQDPDTYWLKGLAFCKALDGDVQSVELAVSILQDQDSAGDEAFFSLARALTGDTSVVVESLIDPTPLQLSMLRAARQTLPADAVPGASPGILRAEATAANADIGLRLAAAEKAEAAGALPTSALAKIYAGVVFESPAPELERPTPPEGDPQRANAWVYQAATIESDPVKRALILQEGWRQARDQGGYSSLARVSLTATMSLEPRDELVGAASDIARVLILSGETDAAQRWFDLVREIALEKPEATAPEAEPQTKQPTPPTIDGQPINVLGAPAPAPPPKPARPIKAAALATLEMWPLMQIADDMGRIAWSPKVAEAWWAGQLAQYGETTASERAALLYSLLDALGYGMKDANWEPLLQGPLTVTAYMPSPALQRVLAKAVAQGRLGETVLLSLLALGDVGPAGADPSTVHNVIRALLAAGLNEEARAIAVEAAVGRGL